MKKVLVTGGGHSEIPLINALHKLGYYVITTGNNADGIGHLAADEYIEGDFSDKEFVLHIAKENQVVGIVSGCNDFAYVSTAYACEKLGFVGHDTYEDALKVHHKDAFRKIMQEAEITTPKTIRVHNKSELLAIVKDIVYPVMLKAVDLTGGKGIRKCFDTKELLEAYEEAILLSKENVAIIEEYIEGTNHGISTLVVNGKIIFAFFDNEEYYLNEYLVAGAYAPADLSDEVKNKAITYIEKIFSQNQFKDGLFHAQCIVSENDEIYIIDPCRRTPGDLYVRLVELSSGIDYSECIVRFELGLDISAFIVSDKSVNRNIARECMMPAKNGRYMKTSIEDTLSSKIIERFVLEEPGTAIKDYLKFKSEILFLEFDSGDEQRDILKKLYDYIRVEVEDE